MLWVDKYRPRAIKDLTYHEDISQRLGHLAKGGELPHLLFYGPHGAGKKTRIMALLQAIFGPGVERLRLEHKTFKIPTASATKVEITTIASNYHVEINPADVGIRDRYVVQEVIKEMARYKPLDTQSGKGFQVVVLMEVDRLSKQAQHALRRTMEKYSAACRLILCCNNVMKVIEPVRSRCLGIRVPAPSENQVMTVLREVCDRERLQLPEPLALRIAQQSHRNVRRAILMLETCRVQQYPFTPNQAVQLPDWEQYIEQITLELTQEQSPQKLIAVRAKLYELLTNCIPSDVILKTLTQQLMKKLDAELKVEVVHWAAFYEHRLHTGSKEIFHLEAFVAKFMSIYKKFLVELYS